ncbi:hypothetical protein GTA62_14795 [Roseobacter sp. HKCCD9010]|uniref:hypothetical protein n=1 Tax=unclassified Roseobacter TaxID=196798 RepID=UPI0014922D52|nr:MULTISPECIES: hypothetical protein [unclassified Roseobacter]MBF9050621.1 hypothetical protein [Rhodobacterales bacterium HKCCD4356]NNV11961.1 hypothetical protein [Roseobacter sp. HKCCD7357]NNV16974.1 hypothetical protein [Roseobacter sp. HKCCD8768]NNV26203.1 hypothetical protein [Roseobacter sp. HKCCD8192]NNV30698.1 hypothetical protein [Roseobacter sp. HKCCD9061]
MTKPVAPTVPPPALRSQPDTFSDRAEVNVSFWPTLTAYMSEVVDYNEEQANALLTGNLPNLSGRAGSVLQVNGSEDGVSLFDATPAGYNLLGAADLDAQLAHLGLDVSIDVDDWHTINRTGIVSGHNKPNAPIANRRFHGWSSYVSETNQFLVIKERDSGEEFWAAKVGSSWGAWQQFGGGRESFVLELREPSGTAGANFAAANTWQTVNLNTEVSDTAGLVTPSGPEFTVNANCFLRFGVVLGTDRAFARARLADAVTGDAVGLGNTVINYAQQSLPNNSLGRAYVSAGQTLRLEAISTSTAGAQRIGVGRTYGTETPHEVFAFVEGERI